MILGQADRYIGKTVVKAVLLVMLCAAALTFLLAIAEEVDALSDRFTFVDVLWLVTLVMPGRMQELVPFVVFLGTVIGLGSLSSHSELTVLRSAGTSVMRLFGSCVIPVLAIFFASWLLSDTIAPIAEAEAVSVKRAKTGSGGTSNASKPFWTRDANTITGIEQVSPDGMLYGIHQYELDLDGNLTLARAADTATYDSQQKQWTLEGVRESRFKDSSVETSESTQLVWRTRHDPESIRTRVFVDPDKLSVSELWQQIRYRHREGLGVHQHKVALWSIVLQPVAILGLILIATGFVVGPLREVGMGQRLTVGILIGLVFHYVQQFFAPMTAVYNIPAWTAVLLPILLAWSVGAFLVRKAR